MTYALTMLVLWGLLFVPLGLAIQALVLGEAARLRALPLAPITGVATALIVLAVLARAGVNAGEPAVAWSFAGVSLLCALAIWRCKWAWRSRELLGVGGLLILAIFLVQLPVVGNAGDGPLGYGTVANPVEEVAAIDAAVGGSLAKQDVAKQAAHSAHERPVAFEQFAALTVGLGYNDKGTDASDPSWTAYSLHAPLTGMLAALVALPLFAFARARGMRWFGLAFLVPIGVLAPYTFLALANGSGAAVATVPLFAAAAFSLLVTKRDRGWWSLTMIFGAGMAVTAGALAILPLITMGIVWIFLRATTYEHLAQADAPVGRVRALAPGVLAVAFGVVGIASTLSTGALLAWPRLHEHVFDAVRSWPFAWLDTDLSTGGPSGTVETAVWLAGPVLLIIAAIHGIIRNERRELAVLLGSIAAALIGLAATSFDRAAGIRILEYTILVTSPLLAALAVRGVALAREHAEGAIDRGRVARIAGWVPAVLIVGFVLVSVASTAVVGTRMVHAPKLGGVELEASTHSLVAGGDQWLAFVVEGDRLPGRYADPDALATKAANSYSSEPLLAGYPLAKYDTLVTSNSPLGSDPPRRFIEDDSLDKYQARLFYDRTVHPGIDGTVGATLEQELQAQAQYTPAADLAAQTESGQSTAQQNADATGTTTHPLKPAKTENDPRPLSHDPVEGGHARDRPDQPAGLLVPASDVPGCDGSGSQTTTNISPCEPSKPVAGATCTSADIDAARSPLEHEKNFSSVPKPAPTNTQIVSVNTDPQQRAKTPLIGVQCFDVQIAPTARVLSLHVRNIGLILAPENTDVTGRKSAWHTTRSGKNAGGISGGVRRTTNLQDATISYGGGRLSTGSFDLTPEGTFGAGVDLESLTSTVTVEGSTATVDAAPPAAHIRGAADGFGTITRDVALGGSATFRNSSGTDVQFGRLFARPRGIPESCDFPLPIQTGARRELRTEADSTSVEHAIQRPGITVTVEEASGTGNARTARVVVGSYLTYAGLARYELLDWTEQFAEPVTYEGCDGDLHTEKGVAPPTVDARDVRTTPTPASSFGN